MAQPHGLARIIVTMAALVWPHFAAASDAPATLPTGRPIAHVIFPSMFTNDTGDEQYEPAAAGVGDLLGMMLAEQRQINIVERQRLAAITQEQALTLRGLAAGPYALQAGRILQADAVLVGRVYFSDGKFTISAKVIEISTERVLAADQQACRPEELSEAALQLAGHLAKDMALPLPPVDLAQLDKSPLASLHFGKALAHYYAGNMDAAIMQFMRTLDLDPDFTEAHYFAGIAFEKLGEPEHAVVEWEAFLNRAPDSRYAAKARELLAAARRGAAENHIPRLGPRPAATQPATKPGQGV